MQITDRGLDIIKEFEGYKRTLPDGRCQAYQCVVGKDAKGRPIYDGKWTIGWGCTEGVTAGMIWTRDQAEHALRVEVAKAAAIVARHVRVPLNPNQADACISLAYNIGEGGFSGSTVLRRINASNFQGAAKAFAMWVNSNGVRNVPGLVRRRAQEAALFLEPDQTKSEIVEPVDEHAEEPSLEMPQSVDEDRPSTAAWHAEAHTALKEASGLYNANRGLMKTLATGVLATGAFLREHGLEIALCLFAGVTVLLALQLVTRNKWLRGIA
ncbi:MAG: lysozyme [Pseudomonadales bacterium]|nr:lysozyme [Pseudomonadales bacterium]